MNVHTAHNTHVRPRATGMWLTLPAVFLLTLFFVAPLLKLLALSVDGWTLEPYTRIWTDGIYLPVMVDTFRIAAIVAALCLVIGYPVSLFLATTNRLWRTLGFAFVMFPLWTSVVVRNYAWMIILGRNGIINRTLLDLNLISAPITILNTELAVVIGMVHVMLPFMILPIYNAAVKVDPEFEKAARGLGANGIRVFTEILLPLTMRGVIAGTTLVFVVSIGFYITPALLGGGKVIMIANLIEQQIRELLAWDFGSALSFVLLIVTLALTWAGNRLLARWTRS